MTRPPTNPKTGSATIRPYRRADGPAVGALTLAAYDAYGTMSGDYRDYLGDPDRRARGCSALLVADLDGEVAGTVTYVVHGDAEWEGPEPPHADAGFRVLAVSPRAEGRGVGRALVERCIDLAAAEERHRLMIASMAWMTRAHELYRRLGFVHRPDLDVRFPNGDGVTFQLDLTMEAASRFPAPGPVPRRLPWFADVWA